MRIVTSIADVREAVRAARLDGCEITFVPTMGALHAGHVSLIRHAGGAGRFVVVSIYVNPTQFNDPGDLAAYPRTDASDESLCKDAHVDLLWRPTTDVVYPPGFDTGIEPGALAAKLEGEHRPGHFKGMATVVLKLLNVVSPDMAYFGRKDFQQLAIVKQMARDLNLPVSIIGCPTVREADGLALSSRNVKLSGPGRVLAVNLSRAINTAATAMRAGETAEIARHTALEQLSEHAGITVEYLEIVDRDSLVPVNGNDTADAVVLVAAHVDGVRLIDNVAVREHDEESR